MISKSKSLVCLVVCIMMVLSLSVVSHGAAETKIWTFNKDLEGWTSQGEYIENLRVENGKAILNSKVGDPVFRSPDNIGIKCADYRYIVLKLKTTSTKDYVDVYFDTDVCPISEQNRFLLYIEPTTEEKEYVMDMALMDTWDGTLNYFRFDDDQDKGAMTEIDFIAITNDPESVSKLNAAAPAASAAPAAQSGASNPKTGDEGVIALAILALASAAVLVFRRKLAAMFK